MKNSVKILAVLTSLFLLTACSSAEEETPELLEPVGVELDTAVVFSGDLYELTNYSAVVVPYVEELSFESSGVISVSNISLGDTVEEGDLLVEIDVSELEEQIESLEETIEYNETIYYYTNSKLEIDVEIATLNYEYLLAQQEAYDEYYMKLEQAQTEADEATEIAQAVALEEAMANAVEGEEVEVPEVIIEPEEVEKPDGDDVTDGELVLAKSEVTEAELSLQQTKANQQLTLDDLYDTLETLEVSIGNNQIYAPCDGVIVYYNNLIVGDKVTEDEVLICIADTTFLSIKSDYISSDTIEKSCEIVANINGNDYEVEYVTMTNEEYTSLVLAGEDISTEFYFSGSYSTVEAGDFVIIEVYSNITEDTLLVPINTTLEYSSKQYYVYTVVDGSLVKTPVTLGSSNDVYMEIIDGLEEGDVVYVGD